MPTRRSRQPRATLLVDEAAGKRPEADLVGHVAGSALLGVRRVFAGRHTSSKSTRRRRRAAPQL